MEVKDYLEIGKTVLTYGGPVLVLAYGIHRLLRYEPDLDGISFGIRLGSITPHDGGFRAKDQPIDA